MLYNDLYRYNGQFRTDSSIGDVIKSFVDEINWLRNQNTILYGKLRRKNFEEKKCFRCGMPGHLERMCCRPSRSDCNWRERNEDVGAPPPATAPPSVATPPPAAKPPPSATAPPAKTPPLAAVTATTWIPPTPLDTPKVKAVIITPDQDYSSFSDTSYDDCEVNKRTPEEKLSDETDDNDYQQLAQIGATGGSGKSGDLPPPFVNNEDITFHGLAEGSEIEGSTNTQSLQGSFTTSSTIFWDRVRGAGTVYSHDEID